MVNAQQEILQIVLLLLLDHHQLVFNVMSDIIFQQHKDAQLAPAIAILAQVLLTVQHVVQDTMPLQMEHVFQTPQNPAMLKS